jgi:hypothetical protein
VAPVRTSVVVAALVGLCLPDLAAAQGATRRLTTVDSIRQYPGYYHLQNVLLRGEFAESGGRILLKSDENELTVQLAPGVNTQTGEVEARGQVIDVGRLEPGDPRVGPLEGRDADRWPRPGEELILRLSAVAPAPAPTGIITVRALALEPWRFVGKSVTVVGNFRGRNLFGDLPGAPNQGPHDFVIRATDGAVWVTGQRPRGRGFDLDVDRRIDSNRWLEVTGTVVVERGLVRIAVTRLAAATATSEAPDIAEAATPVLPPPPLEIVFFSPSDGEVDVSPTGPVRVQFSRGLTESTLTGRVEASYQGAAAGSILALKTTYDAANRAIEIRFNGPLEEFRTVSVRLLDGIKAFDGGALKPWAMSFSVGAK